MTKTDAPVVFIITKLELGGAQKVCLSLFHELEKKNQLTWLISGTDGPLAQQVAHHKRVILLSDLKRECSWRTITTDIRAFFALKKELQTLVHLHPHLIVHTHSTKAGYLGRWAAFFAGISYRIHTVHGFGFHDHQSRIGYCVAYMLELFTSIITSHYVCVSEQDQKTGAQLLPRFLKKSSLIRAAIQDKKFVPARFLPTSDIKHFIFGTVSCFKKQKNLFDLLQAFNIVHKNHPETRLEIIGDGFLRPDIEQWIAHNHLTEAITLHGWIEEVAPLMATWHTFVMSSLWEGLPCAAVEARFLKLPVLAYKVGGLSEIIYSGHNGFLYEPRNINDLSNGMISLFTDRNLYKKLKEYHEDLSTFTIDAMLLQHSMLYRSTVKN